MKDSMGEVWEYDKVYCQCRIERERYEEMTKCTVNGRWQGRSMKRLQNLLSMEDSKGEVWGDDKVYCQRRMAREKYGEMTNYIVHGV